MLTIDEIRETLRDRNLAEVARRAGVGYPTVRRLMAGKSARYEAIAALSDYLQSKEPA